MKADEEVMWVNINTGMGTGGAAEQRYIFKGFSVGFGPLGPAAVPAHSLFADRQPVSSTFCSLCLSKLIVLPCVNYEQGVSNLTTLLS